MSSLLTITQRERGYVILGWIHTRAYTVFIKAANTPEWCQCRLASSAWTNPKCMTLWKQCRRETDSSVCRVFISNNNTGTVTKFRFWYCDNLTALSVPLKGRVHRVLFSSLLENFKPNTVAGCRQNGNSCFSDLSAGQKRTEENSPL